MTKKLCTLLLPGLLAAACDRLPEQPAARQVSLVVRDVTVIDPASRQVRPGRTVFIDDDTVVSIVPATNVDPFQAGQSVDGTGKFLIPGLIDMHVHLGLQDGLAEQSGPLFIANGITGVRDMSSDCWEPREAGAVCIDELRAVADRIESGELTGPRLLAAGSAAVRGVMHRDKLPEGAAEFYYPGNEQQARQLSRYLEERGVDFIKSYKLIAPETWFAMADEAQRIGLEVAGHVPVALNVAEAAAAGQRSIEHARALLYDCSAYGPVYREAMGRVARQEPGAEAPDDEIRLRRTLEEFDPERCERMLGALVEHETYYVPTHETREMDARAAEPAYRDDPRLRYMDRTLVENSWMGDLNKTAAASPEVRALFESFYNRGLELTGMAHESGVRIMAGTDANDTMVFPGFSLHDEFVHLEKAGLEPMEVLRAATIVPAGFLDLAGRIGQVAAGTQADLVLLDANPLDDIRNSREIFAVIFGGRFYDRAQLDALLAAAEAAGTSTERN